MAPRAVVTATHQSAYKKAKFVEATTKTVNYASTAPVDEYIAPALDIHAAAAPVAPVLADFLEPHVLVVKVVQVPQAQLFEQIVEIPDTQTAQGTQTFESLGTAPARRVDLAETVEVMEFAPPLPAESTAPACVTAHVVDVPLVVMEDAQPTPVDEHSAPAPVVDHAALAPVVENIAPTTAVTYAALAPVVEQIAPAPAVTSSTPVCVGDTGFDTWWAQHCEVIRTSDRHDEGEIRVLYAHENPDNFR